MAAFICGKKVIPGMEIRCTTIHGSTLQGHVVTANDHLKAAVIYDSADRTGNAYVVNLAHVTGVQILFEPEKPIDTQLRPVDLQRLSDRIKMAVEARQKKIDRIGVNVTVQAQDLYDCIAKTYNEIRWDGDVIVVLNDVRITPPYRPENCTGSQTCTERLQKIVAKYHKE
ncbi:hypothetical protein EMCRGX_G014129 [Ephydatia muelleri]